MRNTIFIGKLFLIIAPYFVCGFLAYQNYQQHLELQSAWVQMGTVAEMLKMFMESTVLCGGVFK